MSSSVTDRSDAEVTGEPGGPGAAGAPDAEAVSVIDLAPADDVRVEPDGDLEPRRRRVRPTTVLAGLAWVVVAVAALVVVLVAIEPMFQYRAQDQLVDAFQARLDRAANEASGLPGIEVATEAEPSGTPVALLEVGAIGLQQVVVEGASSDDLQAAPGHVLGSAGLGQKGTAVVVGRGTTFGAPFGDLAGLRAGDQILVTTTQGESLYEVRSVGEEELGDGGPTADGDGLVLVTSASGAPWNGTDAVVVRAELATLAFVDAPQGTAGLDGGGRAGDRSLRGIGWALLAAVALVGALVAAVQIQRRRGSRVAYLLAAPPILGLLVLTAERAAVLLPGWW